MQRGGRVLRRAAGAVALVGLAVVLPGCGAAGGSPYPSTSAVSGSPTPNPSASSSPSNSPQVPADGVTLAQLGFEHGPGYLSVPRGTSITTASDQENTVTLVTAAPSASELATYFRRALPATGFTVTGDRVEGSTATLTFEGDGWQGSFTGRDDVSGLTAMRVAR